MQGSHDRPRSPTSVGKSTCLLCFIPAWKAAWGVQGEHARQRACPALGHISDDCATCNHCRTPTPDHSYLCRKEGLVTDLCNKRFCFVKHAKQEHANQLQEWLEEQRSSDDGSGYTPSITNIENQESEEGQPDEALVYYRPNAAASLWSA